MSDFLFLAYFMLEIAEQTIDYLVKAFQQKYRLCSLVVRVPGYRSRNPGFDSRRYQVFWEIVGLERGPLSLMRIIEDIYE
jgi:hypothetical protein